MKTKTLSYLLLLGFAVLSSCVNGDEHMAISYTLKSGTNYNTGGTVNVQQIEGGVKITIKLEGGIEGEFHPAHLHFGAWDGEGEMAAMLNSVDGTTGLSVTELKVLSDNSSMNFDRFLTFDGSIRIHPNDGDLRKEIMAYTNIGINTP
ncbi:hypothetical protein OO013_12685 [Mangrovivirga sp. M17]|uniref:CHRD domain-containing protein n=1 Tax=Mangrovivirga halotolerans TaxID=2993936 RepID=A0ABT3RSG4_9BACT|nr:hypothetical protein [Mangrovivirga halotolerans]MCX2744731.1 hypothetical protein [Mangrovivirga halotolerans]